jgi:kynureninase
MRRTLDEVRALDRDDPLRAYRERFVLPEGLIYLDGNSLGALPRAASGRLKAATEGEWGEDLIRSWNAHDWIGAPQRIGAKIAPLIGAKPNEVIVADSTSVNLFKLLVAAVRLSERKTLLTEAGNFQTDVYIAGGAAELCGLDLDVAPRQEVEDRIGPDTNLLLLTHVHYKTAERFDMAGVTRRARSAGVRTIWDLSHSAGAVPLDLNSAGVELAVGCGYKYLNGGPGAPAFLYIAESLQEQLISPLRGWMGHAAPFAFDSEYVPACGLDRFLAGTPPVLSLVALETGIQSFDGVGMDRLWAKSIALFDLFADLVEQRCGGHRLECISPRDPALRGSHISFRHPHAFEICQALIADDVVGDFRSPDVVRFGLTPLYLGFEDIWEGVERMRRILDSGSWKDPKFAVRGKVT